MVKKFYKEGKMNNNYKTTDEILNEKLKKGIEPDYETTLIHILLYTPCKNLQKQIDYTFRNNISISIAKINLYKRILLLCQRETTNIINSDSETLRRISNNKISEIEKIINNKINYILKTESLNRFIPKNNYVNIDAICKRYNFANLEDVRSDNFKNYLLLHKILINFPHYIIDGKTLILKEHKSNFGKLLKKAIHEAI